jgi:hypothetical protein
MGAEPDAKANGELVEDVLTAWFLARDRNRRCSRSSSG